MTAVFQHSVCDRDALGVETFTCGFGKPLAASLSCCVATGREKPIIYITFSPEKKRGGAFFYLN
jgi:hypothetical protein